MSRTRTSDECPKFSSALAWQMALRKNISNGPCAPSGKNVEHDPHTCIVLSHEINRKDLGSETST